MTAEYLKSHPAPLANPGLMGACILQSGTQFRVWAPHADQVGLVGDFNEWQTDQHPMSRSEDGKWTIVIPNAKVGQNYQFEITYQGRIFRKNDPYARRIDRKRKTSVIYQSDYQWKQVAFDLPTFNDMVIYELHVGTFARRNKKVVGTFSDVLGHLPYLKNLGINTIEIMPPCEFPSELSWGYNLTNPFAVEESYGGPEELRKLVDGAHSLGMAVILDMVYNHFGPDDLDLWQFDGWSENNLGGIYFYNDVRSKTPWGDNRPDYGRGEVRQFIRDNALMWFEEYRVDGLRLDSTIFMRDRVGNSYSTDTEIPEAWSLLQWINDEIASHFPGKIMIAEDLTCNPWITKTTGAGGAGFQAQWDAGFVHPLRHAITTVHDEDRSMKGVADALQIYDHGDAYTRVIYTESHDEVANGKARITTEIAPDDTAGYYAQKRSTLGAGLVLTSPGIPMLFEGQEFLENGWFRDDVPVDWSKAGAYQGITALYRDLVHLRLNRRHTTAGLTGSGLRLSHVNHEAKVVAFHRFLHGGACDDVIVVAHFSRQGFDEYRIGVPVGGLWRVRLNTDWEGYSPEFGDIPYPVTDIQSEPVAADGWAESIRFSLAPYSLLILSQDKTA
jgi:1,4-alpha-glucan branching enzyme